MAISEVLSSLTVRQLSYKSHSSNGLVKLAKAFSVLSQDLTVYRLQLGLQDEAPLWMKT